MTSLSDVAEMNTVTWGPEASPIIPHRAHQPLSSCVHHHVERGTNVVTTSARRRDWEGLSGTRQFAEKDPTTPFEEDGLLTIRSESARNPRMQSCTRRSDVESLSPGSEEGMERGEGHTNQPRSSLSVHSKLPVMMMFVAPAITSSTLEKLVTGSGPPSRKSSGTRTGVLARTLKRNN